MRIEEDELAGTTVWLDVGDDLRKVPATHRQLLSSELRKVFADPAAHFERVRDRSPVPKMRKWFDRVLKKGFIELMLEVGNPPEIQRSGFFLGDDAIRPAIVGLPVPFGAGLYPEPLAAFYRLVGFVDWKGLMFAGKLDGPAAKQTESLTLAYFNYAGSTVIAATTCVIGGSLCGDMMICTEDGRGGWWNHETGEVALMGSAADLLDWVFGELLADRSPESSAIYRKRRR